MSMSWRLQKHSQRPRLANSRHAHSRDREVFSATHVTIVQLLRRDRGQEPSDGVDFAASAGLKKLPPVARHVALPFPFPSTRVAPRFSLPGPFLSLRPSCGAPCRGLVLRSSSPRAHNKMTRKSDVKEKSLMEVNKEPEVGQRDQEVLFQHTGEGGEAREGKGGNESTQEERETGEKKEGDQRRRG